MQLTLCADDVGRGQLRALHRGRASQAESSDTADEQGECVAA